MKELTPKIILLLLFIVLIGGKLLAQEDKSTNSSKKKSSSEIKPDQAVPTSSDGLPENPATFNKQAAIDEIKAQLAEMATRQLLALIEFCKKNDIVGEFVADLTVEGKGKVITVLMVSAPDIPILKKNMLKDKLGELQFENVKIPKKQRVKYRYTLKF